MDASGPDLSRDAPGDVLCCGIGKPADDDIGATLRDPRRQQFWVGLLDRERRGTAPKIRLPAKRSPADVRSGSSISR
jgi:hypothetical protein